MFGFLKRNKKKETQQKAPVHTKENQDQEEKVEKAPKKRKAAIHITRHKDGGWQVKKEGAQRALKLCKTQKEAIELAKAIEKEKGTGYIIHKADGSTRKKKY